MHEACRGADLLTQELLVHARILSQYRAGQPAMGEMTRRHRKAESVQQ